MAAEAACSRGDLPVVAVEARLVAVIGFATAAVVIVVPAELAAAVLVVPNAAKGAAQPWTRPINAKGAIVQEIRMGGDETYFLRVQTVLKTPAAQVSLTTGSNLLSGVLLSETNLPAPLPPENSLKAIGR